MTTVIDLSGLDLGNQQVRTDLQELRNAVEESLPWLPDNYDTAYEKFYFFMESSAAVRLGDMSYELYLRMEHSDWLGEDNLGKNFEQLLAALDAIGVHSVTAK